jgi:branched-chain amino acid transport system permease protein
MTQGQRFYAQMGGLGLAVLLAPLLVSNPYYLNVLNVVALNVIAVTGLNLLIGFAGAISLGHAAFLGLGAYVSGMLSATWGWPPLLAAPVAAAVVALVALVIGLPTLRLEGNYLVMATLGFNLIVNIVMLQADEYTGGPSGLSGIPPLKIFGLSFADDQSFYWLAWALALAGMALARNLASSRVGRGLKALHDSPLAAAAVGVPTAGYKARVFVLSAVYASLAGSLYAHYYGIVSPRTFDIFRSVELVTMCLVGGMGSLWGGFLGAAFLTPLPQALHVFDQYKDVFYGGLLMVLLIREPEGLAGMWERLRAGAAARRAS